MNIRNNRFFKTTYILGSALSIASAMLIVVYLYVKIADIYPENDRSDIYILENCNQRDSIGSCTYGSKAHIGLAISDRLLEAIRPIATEVSIERIGWDTFEVEPDDGSIPFGMVGRMVDDAYFRIFHFELMAGRLYDSVDVESGRPVAVISDLLARRLYGSVEAAIGRELSMNYETYTVCGVVREPSFLMQQSFGQVFVPNTAYGYSPSDLDWLKGEAVGNLKLRVRVSDAEAGRKMTEAVGEVLRAYSAQRVMNEDRLLGSTLTLDVLPITSQSLGMPADFDWGEVFRRYGFMILILLIVPALNLSGMIAGNMETRLPEMGVRKSFGARRGRLFRSVLAENFRLTAIGGIIGLAVAALFVWGWRDWMFFLDDSIMADAPDSVSVIITSDMLFAPLVFIIAFLITFLLNFLAAMIPVWMSLRNPIVESLSESK